MVDTNLYALRMAELDASIALLSLSVQYRRCGMDTEAEACERFAAQISGQGHHRSLVSGQTLTPEQQERRMRGVK